MEEIRGNKRRRDEEVMSLRRSGKRKEFVETSREFVEMSG